MQFVFLIRLIAGLIFNVFFQDKKILFLAIDLDSFSVAEQMCWMHRSDDQRCPKNTYSRLQPSIVVNLALIKLNSHIHFLVLTLEHEGHPHFHGPAPKLSVSSSASPTMGVFPLKPDYLPPPCFPKSCLSSS